MADSTLSTAVNYMTYATAENLYSIRTIKGHLKNGTVLQCWDPIDECTGESCPAYNRCPYKKTGSCRLQREYMRGIHNLVLNNFGDRLTEGLMFRVGMHLFPLYRNLMRLNLEELGVDRVITIEAKGVKRINPIYKEIRETIKHIEFIWKSLGFTNEAPSKSIGDDLKGNPDYYENIQKDADRRKRLVRRKVNK